MSPPRYTTVLWDYGGVFTGSPFHRLDEYAAELGTTGAQLAELVLGYGQPDGDHHWHRLERGELSMTETVELCLEVARGAGLDGFDMGRFFRSMAAPDGHREAMFEGLQRLADRSIGHAIVSNNIVEVAARWRSTLPDGFFRVIVDSSEVGVRKPDPAIYRIALERMAALPEQAVFVDDHAANVEAARALGITSVLVGADPLVALADVERLIAG